MNANFAHNADRRHFHFGASLSRILNPSIVTTQAAETLAGSPLLNTQLRQSSLVVGLVLPKGNVCSFYLAGRVEKHINFFNQK
jgi:hypothetical protein